MRAMKNVTMDDTVSIIVFIVVLTKAGELSFR